jgi:hypothetical protein
MTFVIPFAICLRLLAVQILWCFYKADAIRIWLQAPGTTPRLSIERLRRPWVRLRPGPVICSFPGRPIDIRVLLVYCSFLRVPRRTSPLQPAPPSPCQLGCFRLTRLLPQSLPPPRSRLPCTLSLDNRASAFVVVLTSRSPNPLLLSPSSPSCHSTTSNSLILDPSHPFSISIIPISFIPK